MKCKRSILTAFLILTIVTTVALAGCATGTPLAQSFSEQLTAQTQEQGGTLVVKVNPEIAVIYDENGVVVDVTARNEDARSIIDDKETYVGLATREVVTSLVTAIGEAGYFVEDVEGESRTIIIEIEDGSTLPYEQFVDEVISDVRAQVQKQNWRSAVNFRGNTDYGVTDYNDTDYGPDNDGVTDYNDTDYGPDNDGVTDYNDTDYGPDNDGVTDYNDTDYGPGSDGATDYNDTDYGSGSDGVTDYSNTDNGSNNDDVTDYGNTNYGSGSNSVTENDNSDYGVSDYD